MTPEVARLDVTGDLSLEVDGSPVQVTARRGDIDVVAADVREFVLALRAAARARTGSRPGRADVGRLAGTLADAGLTARLRSPSQHVLTVGAGVDSRLGGLLLGTRLARPDARGVLRASGRTREVGVALVGTLVLLGVAGLRRHGRTHQS